MHAYQDEDDWEGRVDLRDVVSHLKARGVEAEIRNTSGGTATMYAGPERVIDEADGPANVRVVVAGPGWFSRPGRDPVAALEEFSVGPPDEPGIDADVRGVPDGATALQVADVVAQAVADVVAGRWHESNQSNN